MIERIDDICARLKAVQQELGMASKGKPGPLHQESVQFSLGDPAARLRMLARQVEVLEQSLLHGARPDNSSCRELETDLVSRRAGANEVQRICILTPDISGPINNSGIGSACYHASRLLAGAGHEVTICFVHPKAGKKQAMAHWRKFYRKLDVNFIAIAPVGGTKSPLGKTIRASVTAYYWLKKQSAFDLVLVPEWQGLGYYSQLAKHLGLDFADSHFLVRGGSPIIWKQQGSRQLVDEEHLMGYAFMERRSIELADTLVCNSRHLLDWMRESGFELNERRSFCHPDMFAAEINPLVPKDKQTGMRHQVREIVFFGQLTPRKGLLLFCDALNTLCDQGVELPPICFVGALTSNFPALSFIEKQQKKWQTQVSIETALDARQAIAYLSKKNRLAVVASLRASSSMAVNECLEYRIPFIACDVGGIPEFIQEHDRQHVLCKDHHIQMAKLIRQTLELGAYMARPVVDRKETNRIWLDWHQQLGSRLAKEQKQGKVRSKANKQRFGTPRVTVCLTHFNRYKMLPQALSGIYAQTYENYDVVLVDDGSTCRRSLDYLDGLEEEFERRGWKIVRQANLYLGAARNTAVRNAEGELIVFCDDDNVMQEDYISTMVDAMGHSDADILTCFSHAFTGEDHPRSKSSKYKHEIRFLGAAVDWSFFRNVAGDAACLIKRSVFEELGGFTGEYKVGRDDMELYNRAMINGYKLEVVPKPLYHYRLSRDSMKAKHNSFEAGVYRAITPYLEVSSPRLALMIKHVSYLYLRRKKTYNNRARLAESLRIKLKIVRELFNGYKKN